jgi:hypothetical protein
MERAVKSVSGLALFTGLLLAGCGGSGGGADGGDQRLELDERLEPGQVRAGVIERESELLTGPEAHGWLGDYKLYNDRVAFIVQGPDAPRGWGPYGGSLLDADWIRPEGEAGAECFQELFAQIDVLGVAPTSAELVADGSAGGPAQVRFRAEHRGIPLVDAATNGALQPADLEIVQDYLLAADSDHLLVRTSLRTRSGPERELTVGDLVLNGDRSVDYIPGHGRLADDLPAGELDYLVGADRSGCTLYTGADGPIRPAFSIQGITPINVGDGTAPAARGGNAPLVVERVLIAGRGGADDCLRKLRRLRGSAAAAGELTGTVRTSAGAAEAGVSLQAFDLDAEPGADWVSQTYTDEAGRFAFELPAGRYALTVQAPARGGTAERDIEVPAPALLAISCSGRDRAGQPTGPIPCKLSLQPGPLAAMDAPIDRGSLTFALGQTEIAAPPGRWTATLSRGWEYSISRQEIELQPGGRVELSAELTRQVDTGGWIGADLHNHSTRSADSEFELLDKLRANMAEGLELMVATDHDCQADFGPWLELLGRQEGVEVQRWLRTVVGNEVSPLYGHMTVFPLPVHPTGWHYWDIPWVRYADGRYQRHLEFPEIWQRARELGAAVINVAHPTRSSGWFAYLGYEPPAVMPEPDALPAEKWGTDFDTMELLNSGSVDVMIEELVPLWSHLNNRGLFKTAVGVSDTHDRTSESGYGRTLIAVGDDDPATVELDAVWRNLKAGRALVAGGLLVTIDAAGAGPGELVSAASPVRVRVRVEAADWVPLDEARLSLLVDGVSVAEVGLAAAGELDPQQPALRFDDEFEIALDGDAWCAALVAGGPGERLDPVIRGGRAVGMTNAVRIDVDGDGSFTPANDQPGP